MRPAPIPDDEIYGGQLLPFDVDVLGPHAGKGMITTWTT